MTNWDELPDRYWHCQVAFPGKKKLLDRWVANDLHRDTIRKEIVEPWHAKQPFAVSGKLVSDRSQLTEIQVAMTSKPKKHYSAEHSAKMKEGGIMDLATDHRCCLSTVDLITQTKCCFPLPRASHRSRLTPSQARVTKNPMEFNT